MVRHSNSDCGSFVYRYFTALCALMMLALGSARQLNARGDAFVELTGGKMNLDNIWDAHAIDSMVDCDLSGFSICDAPGTPLTPGQLVGVHDDFYGTSAFQNCSCGNLVGDTCAEAFVDGWYSFQLDMTPNEAAMTSIDISGLLSVFASSCNENCYAACAAAEQCFNIDLDFEMLRPAHAILTAEFPVPVSVTGDDLNGSVAPTGPAEFRGVVLRGSDLVLSTRFSFTNADGEVSQCTFPAMPRIFTPSVQDGWISLRFEPLANGDLNCDGVLATSDVHAFVTALVNAPQYDLLFPGCDLMLADFSDDGAVTVSDISGFIQALMTK